jgi:hypothetical protein
VEEKEADDFAVCEAMVKDLYLTSSYKHSSENQNPLNKIRRHELGDEPKQIKDLVHLPQRTRLEVLTLTLVSVSRSWSGF